MIRRYILSLLLIVLSAHLVAAQDITPTPSPTLDPNEYHDQPFFDFKPGDVVAVRTPPGDNLRLRAAPDSQSTIVVNMANGAVATYLGETESLRILDAEGHFAAQEYWYKIKLGRESDTDYENAPEGWALGRRNSINFLIPAPREIDPNYTPQPPCSLAPAQRLEVGSTGRVLPDAIATLYAGPHDLTLMVELAGLDIFTVLGEPVCGAAENYAWRVQYQDFTGWLLETDSDTNYRYLVEPYDEENDDNEAVCPDPLPSQLVVGMQAQPNTALTQPLSVRTRPTITGTDAALLYPGEIVTITEGPLCYSRDLTQPNRTWWLVENQRGVKGWVQETEGTRYLIVPYDPSQATPTPVIDSDCALTALAGVNLRRGPGSEYEIGGSAALDSVLYADGQFAGADGLRWWRLAQGQADAGTWVREDFVRESEGCPTIPTTQP